MQGIQLLNYRDLEEAGFGSRFTIWRKVRTGEFPRPDFDLGTPGRPRPRWTPETVQEHLESRRTGHKTAQAT